jgi:nucleoside triphosphate diphosphatase
MNHDQNLSAAQTFTIATKVQHDASQIGFDWQDIAGVLDKVEEEIAELRFAVAQGDTVHAADELGDLLFAAVSVARFLQTDPEKCLHKATIRFQQRLDVVKGIAEKQGVLLASCPPEELDRLWEQAKKLMRQQLENNLDK